MSRRAWTAAVVATVALAVAPFALLPDPFVDVAAVAGWVVLCALLSVTVVAISVDSGGASPPARPQERAPWRSTIGAATAVWLFFVVTTVTFSGVESLTMDWLGLLAGLAGAGAIFARHVGVTPAGVRRAVRRRQRRRRGGRDLARLGAATPPQRRSWFVRVRRRARLVAVRRALAAFPIAFVLAFVALLESRELPGALPAITVGGALLGGLGLAVHALVTARRDPLLLVGRVLAGIDGYEYVPAEGPSGPDEPVYAFLEHGAARTVTVDVQAAMRILDGGDLEGDARWHGRHTIGARRRVRRAVSTGERVALVCTGNKALAVGRFTDLLPRHDRRSQAAPATGSHPTDSTSPHAR